MLTNPLLDQISNFFTAVTSIYPQLPRQLHQQIKTMQAFLRSYDENQFFLIHNFVRRLEIKADKVKQMNKRKTFKTQPISNFNEQNKQNVYQFMNAYNKMTAYNNVSMASLRECDADKKYGLEKENRQINNRFCSQTVIEAERKLADMQEIKNYKLFFNNYSSREPASHQRLLTMPKHQHSVKEQYSYRQLIKPKSSPYLQRIFQPLEYFNSSQLSIEPSFSIIQINYGQNDDKSTGGIAHMKKSIQEIKELIEGNNQKLKILEVCMDRSQGDNGMQ